MTEGWNNCHRDNLAIPVITSTYSLKVHYGGCPTIGALWITASPWLLRKTLYTDVLTYQTPRLCYLPALALPNLTNLKSIKF